MQGHFEAAPVEDAACSDGDDDDESASSASEEEYEDSSDSGSSSEDEADLPSADPASGSLTEAKTKLAQANAIEEARQLLRDNKDAKNVSYLEDEVTHCFQHLSPVDLGDVLPCGRAGLPQCSSWFCECCSSEPFCD